MEKEIWKPVKGYEGIYEVSKTGVVRSLKRNIHMRQTINMRGYPALTLSKRGKRKQRTVHRIVAESFIPNHENKSEVNHKDGNKVNNNLENLEWATRSENMRHAFSTGLSKAASANKYGNMQGEKHPACKLTEEDILFIRKNVRKNGGNMTHKELCEMFGISGGTLASIVSRKNWKHIE